MSYDAEQKRWYAWLDEHRDDPGAFEDVFLEIVEEPHRLAESGMMPELVRKARKGHGNPSPDHAAGQRMLAVLTRRHGDWFRECHVPRVSTEKYLAAEVALVLQGVELEARTVHYHYRLALDYYAHYGLPVKGGCIAGEIRMPQLLLLEDAPPLTQGVLC